MFTETVELNAFLDTVIEDYLVIFSRMGWTYDYDEETTECTLNIPVRDEPLWELIMDIL